MCIANSAVSQEMSTTKGIVNFEASIPLFEAVESTSKTGNCVLNSKTGELTSSIIVKDFHFKMGLMEQHFNDYYLESERYPKAIFIGKISGFNWYIIGTTPKEFKMKGKLEIHGKKREIETIAFLRKVDNKLEIISNFSVDTKDYNIKIPTVLKVKVAETVNISTKFLVE
jgi:hypothetical protein